MNPCQTLCKHLAKEESERERKGTAAKIAAAGAYFLRKDLQSVH
jgi:hypothetical protein